MMDSSADRAVAIVGVGAILPDAPNAPTFWENIVNRRYSITEVPAERWSIADYYDPDPKAPDKSYSKIGGWVRGFQFDWKRYRMPPKVAAAMDQGQQWAVTIAAEALADYGYPNRPLNTERTAVILGTAMGGELHYMTHLRVAFPEFAHALEGVSEFSQLPADLRSVILARWHDSIDQQLPPITEDSMPGELPNIVSGRVANLLDLHGPNFITDAACASSFAAINAAIEMLTEHQVDAVIAGGVDRNMGASTFVKFCKIGALSPTGSRPFADGADGFVMGEGSASFLLKRLADAERSGDKIYAVIRGIGGGSDGKGKGITAPNPIGQQFAMQRAWENAELDPATATYVEAHGTSTRVGDVVEVESLTKIYGSAKSGSIGLGSAKSNIGHLKAGAGAAGLLKATMAVYHKVLPPTLNAQQPNPNIDFRQTPFYLIHEAREWPKTNGTPRRAGVSAYGFGGTNFHLVIEEHVPGALTQPRSYAGVEVRSTPPAPPQQAKATMPPRGILALGATTPKELKDKIDAAFARVQTGWTPPFELPSASELGFPERVVIDFGTHDELLQRLQIAQKAAGFDSVHSWKPFQAQGIFRGSGKKPGKLAFLFPGQGSQYVNMGRELAAFSHVVQDVFDEADRVMTPILGRSLTSYIFVDSSDPKALMQAEFDLMQTAITQPAMLTLDVALLRLLQAFGFTPDIVMGHSLGEYAALIAAGIMPFADALEAAAARGSEMSKVSMDDNGKMAAVLAPIDVVMDTLNKIGGYVVPANINSKAQCVIGGASDAVEKAVAVFEEMGYKAMLLPVSHAFHTRIVAPASEPLRRVLDRLHITEPSLPLVANVTGELYPTTVDAIKDILQLQIASPVQWVKGLQTLYREGVRTFVECGPKRALKGFVDDVFADKTDILSLLTSHPKNGELPSFNQALCGLYAAGYAFQEAEQKPAAQPTPIPMAHEAPEPKETVMPSSNISDLGQILAQAIQSAVERAVGHAPTSARPFDRNDPPVGSVVISGTGLGLPGQNKPIMDENNALRILRGEQFVDLIPERFRKGMLAKRITRLVKSEDGSGRFETISDPAEVIKLAGVGGSFDLSAEYGVPEKLIEALDITTQLAMAAGIDALREAGIPLVQTYRRASTGKYLPDRWLLPESLRDDTGVIFASAFPGGDRYADEFKRYYTYQDRLNQLALLEDLQQYTNDSAALTEISRRISDLRGHLEREPYEFDRRFIFRVLAMGHSQFAEYIGARGPNTHVNQACASTAQGIALAEDWIRTGRCRRVIVLGADDVTSDNLMEWVGAGFLATGAAATDDRVEDAALPFDRRRHGTLLGMGACALVVESEDAVRERGMRGLVEILSSETRNSAYHGTRLDVEHISLVMNELLTSAERRFGINRFAIAPQMVFMSHETFTPARGGSAAAEVVALRNTFGDAASDIVVANTKGFTGHPMGVGIEDVIAVKILEYGIVPPVPNYKEVDPDLGRLNLSRGGRYPVQYALHLSAGFGSQISMTLVRRIPGALDRIDNKPRYQRWLDDVSGIDHAETEIVKRNLRVKENGLPARTPAPSTWQYGTGPTLRAPVAGDNVVSPAPNTPPPRPVIERPSLPKIETIVVKPTVVEPAPAPIAPSAPVVPPMPVVETPAPVIAAAPADTVKDRVLEIVAQQTGYPVDMLDPDLDLEADLGVDTVKQAETFAAIRAAFDIPRQDSLKLREYPTLNHVISYVRQNRPDLAAAPVPSPTLATAAAPTPAPAPVIASAPAADPVVSRVLEIVAAQTGYPQDMLDLDLDLEADLGVDTVKQAETFAAIRTAFDIPRLENMKLRDYPTLNHVIGFVRQHRPDLVTVPVAAQASAPAVVSAGTPAAVPTPAATPTPPSAPAADPVVTKVLEIVAAQTGYPQDMLDLDLDLEADLGVDTVKQAETFAAIRTAFNIPRLENMKLRDYPTLNHVIGFVRQHRPDLAAPQPPEPDPTPTPPSNGSVPESSADAVVNTVLGIVAAQTGYPQDMLDLDLDLEADLGVDTVKQAETFAAIRTAFNIPRLENMKLRDYPTLNHVIGFVRQHRPDLANGNGAAVAAAPAAVVETKPAIQIGSLEDADRIPRRVPTPSLRPILDLCKPTGVTLDENSRVIVALDKSGVGTALVGRLQKRGVTVLTLESDAASDAVEAQIKAWLEAGAITGVYWLPALDVEPAIEDMDLTTWRELNRQRVKNLYVAMRTLYATIITSGNFIVTSTRLGGLHSYSLEGATAPLGGAVVGFTKAYKRERGDVLVKAVDFEVNRKTAALADVLIAETLADPGIVEVGYVEDERYTVTLVEQPAADGGQGLTLDKETVFLVTGAAGGITSAIISDLAGASGGIFYLLDLVAAPAPDDPRVALFRSDKEALKRRLIEDAKARGEKPTPAQIDKQVMGIEREEAALRAIESVQAAGGTPYYYSVNLLDSEACARVIEDVRARHGRLDVLVHAGGLEISRSLGDKDAAQFNLVFDVKADGFFNLLRAAKGLPIGATVAFSSVAGRFGNNGQTDYSAANDLLCKITSSLRRWRPETRGIVIDWTAWGGIGMATRGSIPKIMEMAGIDMLPPESGIPTVRRELMAGSFRGEIVVGDRLGVLVQEWDAQGGLDTEKVNAQIAARKLLMLGSVKAAKLYGGLEVETTLDPNEQPFLFDHQIDGTPVLPGVMGTEAFAEIASALAPGYTIAAVRNVQFNAPFKFYRGEPGTLYLSAFAQPAADGELIAHTTLRSVRELPNGTQQEKVHFTADVRLTRAPLEAPTIEFTPPQSLEITADRIYRVYFHGPAYQVMECAGVINAAEAIALMRQNLPPNSSPADAASLVAPRLIEFCFQTAGIWEMTTQHVMALPMAIGSVTTYRQPEQAEGRRLYARVQAIEGGFNAQVVDESGAVYVSLNGYRTVQLPGNIDL